MRRLWIVVPLLICVGLGIFGYYWWTSSASTSVSITGDQSTSSVLASEVSLRDWQTDLFHTKVPASLRTIRSDQKSSGPIFASYLLTSSAAKLSDQLAVTIGSLGNGSLDEISAVKVRANQSADYQPTSYAYLPSGALAFSHHGSYEASVFWQHERQYVAVVVSGTPDRTAELDQTMQDIIINWQWQ